MVYFTSTTKWKWSKGKVPEIFVIVLFTIGFTFFLTLLLSIFPFPAPDMKIVEPLNNQLIQVPYANPDGTQNGTLLNVNISIYPGQLSNIIYDSEIAQRFVKILNWDPKIWVMVRKNDEVELTPILNVENFAKGFANVPITLYTPGTWDIELLSLNAIDDETVRNYLAVAKKMNKYPLPIDRTRSAYPIDKIRIITYTGPLPDWLKKQWRQ